MGRLIFPGTTQAIDEPDYGATGATVFVEPVDLLTRPKPAATSNHFGEVVYGVALAPPSVGQHEQHQQQQQQQQDSAGGDDVYALPTKKAERSNLPRVHTLKPGLLLQSVMKVPLFAPFLMFLILFLLYTTPHVPCATYSYLVPRLCRMLIGVLQSDGIHDSLRFGRVVLATGH